MVNARTASVKTRPPTSIFKHKKHKKYMPQFTTLNMGFFTRMLSE